MMNMRIENFGKILGGVSGYPMIGGKMKGIERYSIYSHGKEDRETGIYLIIHIFSARIHGHLLCASHFSDTDDTVANEQQSPSLHKVNFLVALIGQSIARHHSFSMVREGLTLLVLGWAHRSLPQPLMPSLEKH